MAIELAEEQKDKGKYMGRMYVGTDSFGKVLMLAWEYQTGRIPSSTLSEGHNGMAIYVIDRYENDPRIDMHSQFHPEQWKTQPADPYRPDPYKVKTPVPEDYAYLTWFAQQADFGPADGDVKHHMRRQYEQQTGNKVPSNWRDDEGEEG